LHQNPDKKEKIMTTLNHEIFINAPVSKVWATLSDLSAVQLYNPTVLSARIDGNASSGVGACRICELKPKGKVKERVTVWEPERRLGLEVVESDWPIVFMKWETSLQAKDKGTLVTQQMNYQVKFGLLGSLLNALVMQRKLDASITDIFVRMKTHIEN
jgi:ligand-binding SRPBCC domain-containing protein